MSIKVIARYVHIMRFFPVECSLSHQIMRVIGVLILVSVAVLRPACGIDKVISDCAPTCKSWIIPEFISIP